MDALQEAREFLQRDKDMEFGRILPAEVLIAGYAKAQAYAALAQAEQLKRIVETLYINQDGKDVPLADILLAIYETLNERE